jgi:integrase
MPTVQASPHCYRQCPDEWWPQWKSNEHDLSFKAFIKVPADRASRYTVTRMNARDDDRPLQASVVEDEKSATRAYFRSPEGYMFNPRFAGASGRKFWLLTQMRLGGQFRKPGRYTAFFFLVLECACTPESLLKLEWDEIDLASGTVFLQLSNSETFRPAAISEFLCRALGDLPRVSVRPFTFDMRHVHRVWRRISARARLGFLTLYELQAEGAWRQLEAMRAASFIVRPPSSPADTAPGQAAIDALPTLQTALGRFAPPVSSGATAGRATPPLQLPDSDDSLHNP